MRIWLKKKASRQTEKSGSFLTRLRRDSRGNTLAIAGAALVPIAGMIGSGLDMSRAYMAQAKLQNACDASALAARREMSGTSFDSSVSDEGQRFFDFNFPSTTMNAQNISTSIIQSPTNDSTVAVTASADIPTTVMSLFGKDTIPISVSCDANQDYGNNDIMVVLDVTGSMNRAPSTGGSSKISRLRTGAVGLYRALQGASNTRTRYGIIPYSMNVNVGRRLRTRDILRTTLYPQWNGSTYVMEGVHINDTIWADSTTGRGIRNWRQSGQACVEERPTIGESDSPITISSTSVTQDDIDLIAINGNDTERQWGRMVPGASDFSSYDVCPNEATRLRTYGGETGYQNAINAATVTVSGNTYHDLGLIWAARFLSSTGMYASSNPEEYNGVPVSKHIVFLTDGDLVTTSSGYTSYGSWNYFDDWDGTDRVTGSGGQSDRHESRFLNACTTAKSMGMTIWVIAFDVTNINEIEPCATSSGHFYTSDGSDLEEVFEQIGQGIGRLRLTQ